MEQEKVCTKCEEFKGLEMFYFRKDSGKYRNECKSCIKKSVKEYSQTGRGKQVKRNSDKKYRQSDKGKESLIRRKTKFYENNPKYSTEYYRVWRNNNLEKSRKIIRNYQQNNIEKVRESNRKSRNKRYQNNPEYRALIYDCVAKRSKRTKSVGGDFLTNVKKAIFKRDKGMCQCCGIELSMQVGGNASFDHKIPVYWGGRSTVENGQLLCKSCNSSKGNKLIDEILTTLPNPDDNIVWEVMNNKFKELKESGKMEDIKQTN